MTTMESQFNNYFNELMRKPSSSIDFMQALKRAKEESLKTQDEKSNDSNRIQERIKKFNMHLNPDTDNTGDCQFDSVADQLKILDPKYDGITKEDVRHIAIDWLKKNGDYKLNPEDPQSETLRSWVFITQDCMDWSSYCEKMSKAREWGDEITFKAITEAFNVIIVLISSTVDEKNFLSEHKPKVETTETKKLYLCHFLEVHYCSLISEEVLKKNEDKKKEKLIGLLKRADKNTQKRTILDVFCMDSPQNEIPQSLMEEMIDNNVTDLGELFDMLASMTGVNTIKIHRITNLQDKIGPTIIDTPVKSNLNVNEMITSNTNGGMNIVNLGVVENLNSKIKSLETMLEFYKKKAQDVEEENVSLKNLISDYRTYMDKQNEKIEEYELNKIKDSNVPKKNGLIVEDILAKEIILRYHLIECVKQNYVILYKEGDIFCEKMYLPEKAQGELYFNKPEAVDKYYFKLFSPNNEVLATSKVFIISPKVVFKQPIPFGNIIEVKWEIKNGNTSSYDWIGIFKAENTESHIQYFYATPQCSLNFRQPPEKGKYLFKYFSAEKKYLPISEIEFEI